MLSQGAVIVLFTFIAQASSSLTGNHGTHEGRLVTRTADKGIDNFVDKLVGKLFNQVLKASSWHQAGLVSKNDATPRGMPGHLAISSVTHANLRSHLQLRANANSGRGGPMHQGSILQVQATTAGTDLAQQMIRNASMAARVISNLGNVTQLAQEMVTQWSSFSRETKIQKLEEFSRKNQEILLPIAAYSITLGATTLIGVLSIFLALTLSGVGFKTIQEQAGSVPLIGQSISSGLNFVDPSLGNAGIALLLNDVALAPLVIPLAALLTPKVSKSLEQKLLDSGLDAESLKKKFLERDAETMSRK